jgi:arylsulfatase A-like enzyme
MSGRTPIHHGEQLSGIATDDIDLRMTLLPNKVKQAGYTAYATGKGHTGYKSMHHLWYEQGTTGYVGYLSGAQSYTSNQRWQDDHPFHQDSQFINPPPGCGNSSDVDAKGFSSAAAGQAGVVACSPSTQMNDTSLPCADGDPVFEQAGDATACCALCVASAECTHWVYAPSDAEHPPCHLKAGPVSKACIKPATGSTSGISRPVPPSPSPPPSGPAECATEYGTDLYGSVAEQYINEHGASTPMFLYLAFQDQHTPYDAPPWSPPSVSNDTYRAMMWAGDTNLGRVVEALKAKSMWEDTIMIYVSDNGGVGDGLNWPKRGEKHSNWEGGLNVAAFVAGGALPNSVRGTTNDVVMHVADLYSTVCSLAGVDPADGPAEKPLPVDPSNPHFNIYGNNSYPAVDGVDVWDMIVNPSSYNISSAHPYLVASREVVYKGQYKLLVSQPLFKTQMNGWKQPNGTWILPKMSDWPCAAQDLSPLTSYLPGIPGQLPCLFDLSKDPNEHTNIAADNLELVNDMWAHLNATVLTMRDCSGWSGPIKGPGGGCSPPELLGPCDEACADNYWYSRYGGEQHGQGPICDVPTCNSTAP